MTGHYVAHDAKGYQVWRLVNGLYRQNVGPHFPTPRAAMAYADSLDAASDISPLPATRRADEPDPADGFWGAIASGDADRQPAGWPNSFWARVDQSAAPDACWPWMAGRDSKNYGHVQFEGRTQKAHRVALILATGRIGVMALHSCDNPPCCNPAHLRWGDNAANVADMVARNRAPAHMRPQSTCRRALHPLTGGNVLIKDGRQHCRACINDRRLEKRLSRTTAPLLGSPVVAHPPAPGRG